MTTNFRDTVSLTTNPCVSQLQRLTEVKVMLDAAEEAYFNALNGGAIKDYKVNTGQTVIEVEVSDIGSLRKIRDNLAAEYNERCQIYNGTNVMVMRDASTTGR